MLHKGRPNCSFHGLWRERENRRVNTSNYREKEWRRKEGQVQWGTNTRRFAGNVNERKGTFQLPKTNADERNSGSWMETAEQRVTPTIISTPTCIPSKVTGQQIDRIIIIIICCIITNSTNQYSRVSSSSWFSWLNSPSPSLYTFCCPPPVTVLCNSAGYWLIDVAITNRNVCFLPQWDS